MARFVVREDPMFRERVYEVRLSHADRVELGPIAAALDALIGMAATPAKKAAGVVTALEYLETSLRSRMQMAEAANPSPTMPPWAYTLGLQPGDLEGEGKDVLGRIAQAYKREARKASVDGDMERLKAINLAREKGVKAYA